LVLFRGLTGAFVIARYFYYKINYRWTGKKVLYWRNCVIKGVLILRFPCTLWISTNARFDVRADNF
jgi:hypothetical protein